MRATGRGDAITAFAGKPAALDLSTSPDASTAIDTAIASFKAKSGLTRRQAEVLRAALDGPDIAYLARLLTTEESTMKTHSGRIVAKLGAKTLYFGATVPTYGGTFHATDSNGKITTTSRSLPPLCAVASPREAQRQADT
jgi:DNA-binding CsgD family transcriptional regulator